MAACNLSYEETLDPSEISVDYNTTFKEEPIEGYDSLEDAAKESKCESSHNSYSSSCEEEEEDEEDDFYYYRPDHLHLAAELVSLATRIDGVPQDVLESVLPRPLKVSVDCPMCPYRSLSGRRGLLQVLKHFVKRHKGAATKLHVITAMKHRKLLNRIRSIVDKCYSSSSW